VVDDQLANIKLITAYLQNDYEIISAYSGEEALEKVELENPDIVLLDIKMPGIDGYEVCKRIKQVDSTRFMPVVMISALSDMEDRIKAIEVDADDFLIKPINGVELITRIKSLLRAKHFHNQLVENNKIIETQYELKTILTDLIPFLFKVIDPANKNIVIQQMSEEVETFLWTKQIQKPPSHINEMAEIYCNLMNQIGANFSIQHVDDKNCILMTNRCPWSGDSINPMFCMLGKAVFIKVGIRLFKNITVNIEKSMADGDSSCRYRIICKGDCA